MREWEWGGLGSAGARGTLEETQEDLWQAIAPYTTPGVPVLFLFFSSLLLWLLRCVVRCVLLLWGPLLLLLLRGALLLLRSL